MTTISRWVLLTSILALLAACGGSSSGGFGSGGEPSITIQASTTSVPANPGDFQPDPDSEFTVPINVRVRLANGTSPADGTGVTLASSNGSVGVVSSTADPLETGTQAAAGTSGGTASFWFTSGPQEGTVTLTASVTLFIDDEGNQSYSDTLQITVTPNDGAQGRLTISGSPTMPANTNGVPIFFGSPYINELTLTYVGPDGNAGSPADAEIGVAIAPVTLAAFSTLDDPETEDINEFTTLLGNGPVGTAAGQGSIYVHSDDQPGTVTVTASVQDANTGENFSQTFDIEIVDGAANFLPASIGFDTNSQPVYVQGSGGDTTKSVEAIVQDAGDNPVPDPEAGPNEFNNVRLELAEPTSGGARLSGTGAGGSVQGQVIDVQTVNGIANFAINAGTETGQHRVIATVDRADNNVDNDLQDPLTAEFVVSVGDGRLFDLAIENPSINAILINRVSNIIDPDEELEVDEETGVVIPPDPDGTYSLTMTVIGTDQVGNPALSGTPIAFGKLDAPLSNTNPPFFVFSGPEGDPDEGGTLFSVLDPGGDGFLDDLGGTDEAAEAGDTVAMFGKEIEGNREHEAARFVGSVIDDNTVNVTQSFNLNDGSGNVVDDGNVIPWVIGRSQVGNIGQQAELGEQGRASVQLTYPIFGIGRPIVVWAQGNRADNGGTTTVADVASMVFPGVAPLRLSAQPNQVAGNSEAAITICLADGLGAPVSGVFINAAVSGGDGFASLDGDPLGDGSQDSTANATASNGCVVTTLATQGMIPDGEPLEVTFFVGSAFDIVTVQPPGNATLSVTPSRFLDLFDGGSNVQVTLTLLEPGGNPISGVALTGECGDAPEDGNLAIVDGPGITDSSGQTTATVNVDVSQCGSGNDGNPTGEFQCTFTTDSGSPVGTFTAVAFDLSDSNVSPPLCP